MINDLMTGISQAIRRKFPETTHSIYTEGTEEVMQVPYFYILCVSQSHKAKLDNRFSLDSSFAIQYFPKAGSNECWEVAEQLCGLLEEIFVDGSLVRGSNMGHKVENGALHFLIDYNLPMMYEKEAVELMGEVTIYEKNRK